MRKVILRVICTLMSAICMASVAACKGSTTKRPGYEDKEFDPTKTQLEVFTYKAGFGDDWLFELETAFEEAYADYSFETGKTGVQVWHKGDMKTFTYQDIQNSEFDVLFLENANYNSYVNNGVLEEISDIVTKDNTDGKTIESKLSAQQKALFEIDNKYYGLPGYIGDYGIIYNIDLWEERGYYIADNWSYTDFIIGNNKDRKKSAGPDGEYKTYDDGLPATYEEFYLLCEEIYADNKTVPLSVTGQYIDQHLGGLMNVLACNYNGYEQALLNYTYDGTAKNLISVNNGVITELPDLEIKPDGTNVGELGKQAGNYYAMEFVKEILDNENTWLNDGHSASQYSHTDCQRDYLRNGTTLNPGTSHAMLIDGCWWQAEASSVFENMAKTNPEYAATSRNFGWMPLPKQSADQPGKKPVFTDYLRACVVVRKGTKVKDAATEFIKFSRADENLVKFTQTTGTLLGYDYELTSDEMAQCSTFTKSLIQYVNNADILYMESSADLYLSKYSQLTYDKMYSASIDGKAYNRPINAFLDNKNLTAEAYFNAFCTSFANKF